MLLNCHTCYSFHYGTIGIAELFSMLKQNGYDAFVLSDINNTSACLDSIRQAPEHGINVIAGIDFRNGSQQQYVGIARNNAGFTELNEHLSAHLHTSSPFESIAPEFTHAYIVYPLNRYAGQPLKNNEFIGVSISDLRHLAFSPYKHFTHKLVALHEVSFQSKRHYNAHRLLRAIDANCLLSKLPQSEQASGNEFLLPRDKMIEAYASNPHIISNTQRILDDCHISFEYGKLKSKNLKFYNGHSYSDDMDFLRSKCMENLPGRFPQVTRVVTDRIEKELEVIREKEFASYYLINWDIVNYARHKDYYYVGRGSGSNSLIAYLLHITDVDPIELDLYFERFINIYRANAPDFDIDFSWRDREDITTYIFNRFGNKRTALLGAYNTFQHKATIRELGKVFGLPPGEIEALQRKGDKAAHDPLSRQLLRYSTLINKLPGHLSIHSSGIIISEKPISTYSATFLPPKGFPTTQFSMQEAEDIGLFKFDILSQRGLGKIKDALTLIKQNKNIDIDIHDIARFKKDEAVKKILRKGNTIGCFYVESPAMRMLLSKLEADDYLRLVAASSIIRPGVSKSGMMRAYIQRYRNVELRTKAEKEMPELYSILHETYGVMVYQEDVIKVAHLFAGLTLAEADHLRRGMSWKFKERNEFKKVRDKFYANCMAKGYRLTLIHDIWNQIESFANFAFSKGHSASYAVESFQAIYLKAYFPLEYMTATLNNGGGFYPKDLYVHEARLHGATIKPPCINNSNRECAIQGNTIFLGLSMVAELSEESQRLILHERMQNGNFANLFDFMERVSLPIEQMRLLIRAGAFDFHNTNRKELLWSMHGVFHPLHKNTASNALFGIQPKKFRIPELIHSALEDAFDEHELFGFTLSCSPFDIMRDPPQYPLLAKDIPALIGKEVTLIGYLIHNKRTFTSKGENMYFGTFIDREGQWIDTVHFPDSAKKYPFTGRSCYVIKGRVTEEYSFISIEVSAMKRIPVIDREVQKFRNEPVEKQTPHIPETSGLPA